MWHGMGDTCCDPESLGAEQKVLEDSIPGVYVHSLMFGKNLDEDEESGLSMPCNKQVEDACAMIASDPKLKDGYNAIGYSQGGQFLRAVAQRCPSPPMKNLITLGSQHQGIYGLPDCNNWVWGFGWICNLGQGTAEAYFQAHVYEPDYQNNMVQAQYWHDPYYHGEYVEKSQFLAKINGEGPNPNATYAENLLKLEKMVLVMYSGDTVVVPRESSHFKFYKEGQSTEIVDFDDESVQMGLKDALMAMRANGQIDYLVAPGGHVQHTDEWFKENIISVYLM